MLTVKAFRSISEIAVNDWNSINTENSYYKSHEFLNIIEKSNIENSDFWYIIIYRGDEMIGATVFSSFVVSLDLFLDDGGKKVVKFIRKSFPKFLMIRFLFCGIPISQGKNTILIKNNLYSKEILETIVNEAKSIAKANKIKFMNFKEFYFDENSIINHLSSLGFTRSWSIPSADFYNRFDSFADYFQTLRYSFRRQIIKSMRKVNFESVGVFQNSLNTDHVVIEVVNSQEVDAKIVYEQYLNVMANASTVLEYLNLDFFENFLKYSKQAKMLLLKKESRIIANAILVEEKDILNFMLIGIDEEYRNVYDSYFNILNAVIAYGINKKFPKIVLGQTSYYAKSRLGGEFSQMVTYNYSSNKLINIIIRLFNKIIFPKVKLQQYRVFKDC